MKVITREYYKLRNPAMIGEWNEYYSSNNGTSQWSNLKQIKGMLTRGQASGYKGRIRTSFNGWIIVKMTERVEITESIVTV